MKKPIESLIASKKQKISAPKDIEKMNVLESLLEDKNCFFKINIYTALAILEFLEVPAKEALDYYTELISAKNFHDNNPIIPIDISEIYK